MTEPESMCNFLIPYVIKTDKVNYYSTMCPKVVVATVLISYLPYQLLFDMWKSSSGSSHCQSMSLGQSQE